MEYSKELTIAINKYNDNLKSIANNILNLQLDFTDTDIEMKVSYRNVQESKSDSKSPRIYYKRTLIIK